MKEINMNQQAWLYLCLFGIASSVTARSIAQVSPQSPIESAKQVNTVPAPSRAFVATSTAIDTEQQASFRALAVLGAGVTHGKVSISKVKELDDDWFWKGLVSSSSPGWVVHVSECRFPFNAEGKEWTFGPFDLDVTLRASDGAVLAIHSPWVPKPEEDFAVHNQPHDEYEMMLTRKSDSWKSPASTLKSSLQDVLQAIVDGWAYRAVDARQIVVHVVDRGYVDADASTTAQGTVWFVDVRSASADASMTPEFAKRNPSLPGMNGPPTWWNDPEKVLHRKCSMLIYSIEDGTLHLGTATNDPFPLVVAREPEVKKDGDK